MKKFLISLALVFLGLCGLSLTSVYNVKAEIQQIEVSSYEELATALSSNEDASIIIKEDIEITNTITLGEADFTIISTGKTISRGADLLDKMLHVSTNSTLTLGGEGSTLNISGAGVEAEASAIRNEGTLNILSGTKISDMKSSLSGVVVSSNSKVVLDGGEICNNILSTDGEKYGIIYFKGANASFEIKSGSIHDNTSNTRGIVFMSTSAVVKMTGGSIYNNTALTGAGITGKGVGLLLGGSIYKNTSEEDGAGIYLDDDANYTLDGTEIYQNYAGTYGAGIYIKDSSVFTIRSGEIRENTSAKSGAATFVNVGATLNIQGGKIINNKTESGNGGASNSKGTINMTGGEVSGNATITKGGAFYSYDGGILNISGGVITGNRVTTTTTDKAYGGGGIYGCEDARITITGGEISGNTTIAKGGAIFVCDGVELNISGGIIKNNKVTSNSTDKTCGGGGVYGYGEALITITGGQIYDNEIMSTNSRGANIYVAAGSTSGPYPTLSLLGGEVESADMQYAITELGGVKMSGTITCHAGVKANYAKFNIVDNIVNPLTIKAQSNTVETTSTANHMLNITATSPYFDVYSSLRNISFTNKSGARMAEYVDGEVLYVEKGHDITGGQNTTLAKGAVEGETVSFRALDGYSLSKVTVTGTAAVSVTENNGVYSFVMPAESVVVNYDVTKVDCNISLEEGLSDLINVALTAQVGDTVNVSLKDSNVYKLIKLYYEFCGERFEIEPSQGGYSFNMFYGAKLVCDKLEYMSVTVKADNLIQSTTTSSLKTNLFVEGDEVAVSITKTQEAEGRYTIQSAYYIDDVDMVYVDVSNNVLTFEMPNHAVELVVVFVDAMAGYQNIINVATETEFINALTGENATIVIMADIEITSTVSVPEGEFTIVALSSKTIKRASSFKGNMFDVGFGSKLTLNNEENIFAELNIDGNKNNVTAEGSIIYVHDNGELIIGDRVNIQNNKIADVNPIYTTTEKGNANAGGAGIYNYLGVVYMYGGSICGNESSFANGAGVYNYGSFFAYGGKIAENTAINASGAGVYNIRYFVLGGGSVSDNIIPQGGYGAGIYNANSKYGALYIYSGDISRNQCASSGAGIFTSGYGFVWVEGGLFYQNKSSGNGGAIASKGMLYIYGGEFVENQASKRGGAIHVYQTDAIIASALFEANSSDNGGALSMSENSKVVIDGCEFVSNGATTRAGAIYVYSSEKKEPTTCELANSVFVENSAREGNSIAVQYGVLKIYENVELDSEIETVSNPTESYGYIEFCSEDIEDVLIKPNKYQDYAEVEHNVLRTTLKDVVEIAEAIEIAQRDGGVWAVNVIDNKLIIQAKTCTITADVDGVVYVPKVANVGEQITPKVKQGYTLTKLMVNGVEKNGSFVVEGDCEVEFEVQANAFNISSNDAGVMFGGNVVTTAEVDTLLEIVPILKAGYYVEKVLVNGETCEQNDGKYFFEMAGEDVNIEVVYDEHYIGISVNYQEAGRVEYKTIRAGSSLELEALELAGYVFEGWFIGEDMAVKYEGQAINQSTTIYAKFTKEGAN